MAAVKTLCGETGGFGTAVGAGGVRDGRCPDGAGGQPPS